MEVERRWFCTCSGRAVELEYAEGWEEGEPGEPACARCGATPSSDPKQTLVFRDLADFDD